MTSEETPLLGTRPQGENVYDRFSPGRKRFIVTLAALTGTFPMFTSGSFVPLIPQIARDLDSTGAVISLAVSLSILTNAMGSLTWATYSTYYGRRPVVLRSLSVLCVGSIGAGAARTVPELLFFRVVQAFGASSGLSVGMGILADIYKMEERGSASGFFYGAILLGMSLAPTVGGITAHYYSWRATQYILAIAAFFSFVVTAAFQPETSQPGARGIDKISECGEQPGWVWLNPFSGIALLRSPNVFLASFAQGLVVLTDYVLLIPIAYTLGEKYEIKNEALIGALCIPVGIGNITGSWCTGRISDRLLVYWRKRRGGVWYPEDRLRASFFGGLVLTPLSVLFVGWITQYGDSGRKMMWLNFACLYLNGIGVSAVLNPSSAYLVDILHSRSAEVTAANMACRNGVVALIVSFIIPSINNYGIGFTNTVSAMISWVGFAIICLVILYGDRLRACVDLGFSTAETN